MTEPLRIFDDVERTDSAPAYDTEDSFTFLNRVARPSWARVRELTERWFADYPASDQSDLRSRFWKPDAAQHYGAGWELYVYTLYRSLGYEVTVHPTLPDTKRKPDFLVTRDGISSYVECVVFLAAGGSGSGQRSWIFECTNKARDPNFVVNIEVRRDGSERPKAAEIIRPLEKWLSSLDPDELQRRIDTGQAPPYLKLDVRGWSIEYDAWPVRPECRGAGGRLIGAYPMVLGVGDDEVRLREIVKYKGARYGSPDKPLVIAVLNTSGFTDERDMTEALFGTEAVEYIPGQRDSIRTVRQRDGYWRQGPNNRGTRVAAVLLGQNISPWHITHALPELWLNPWADRPLIDTPPFATRTAHDTGQVYLLREATAPPSAVFGLDPEWPHFDR
ncbi:hypothetical protein [Mycolicibacterium sediminis]|uniref:Uncharacterized protein n=1 Tax=Mycolicibacterium sediminis TaxID=1286180 RepID=A0A7I7QPX0_9MYCO|nr:hypothetical protein [Mycolicibacterium sediminis]BBY28130.1 hypothetical protein MSEDJ_22260 [Mycolicibacterium sediminis]